MQVLRHAGVEHFVAAADPLICGDEVQHAMMWLIVGVLRERPEVVTSPPYLATVASGDRVVGAAAMLPGRPLMISPLTPPVAMPLLADDLVAAGRAPLITDALSTRELVRAFTEAWSARTGAAASVRVEERLYRIDSVPLVPAIPGRFRLFAESDVDMLAQWLIDFEAEAWGVSSYGLERVRSGVRTVLERGSGGYALWEDGGSVVSVAGFGGTSPRGMRIGPVYTPPQHRGRGYASATTAATVRHLFEELGRSCCFLYANVANHTANHVYTSLGFRPVSDWTHMSVQPPAA